MKCSIWFVPFHALWQHTHTHTHTSPANSQLNKFFTAAEGVNATTQWIHDSEFLCVSDFGVQMRCQCSLNEAIKCLRIWMKTSMRAWRQMNKIYTWIPNILTVFTLLFDQNRLLIINNLNQWTKLNIFSAFWAVLYGPTQSFNR